MSNHSQTLIETPQGPARVQFEAAAEPRAWMALGHGAGGGVAAPDLQLAKRVALEAGISVALVEQPYRVAGKAVASTEKLDEAWIAVIQAIDIDLPLISGGRSSGARVACRTANATGAAGVLCLAFPLQPPTRKSGHVPPSRLDELRMPSVPVLVIQGERDQFGMPPRGRGRTLVKVDADHGLKRDHAKVEAAIRRWLHRLRT